MSNYRYPWPASALTRDDMAMLHRARSRSPGRVPITQLIAEAVRAAYGHLACNPIVSIEPEKKGSHHVRTRIQTNHLEENQAARFAA